MAAFTATETGVRILGLGNEILADDAFGILVAQDARRRFGKDLDVVCSSEAGFDLLDHLLGVSRLLIVDTVVTGRCQPGTMRVFPGARMEALPGGSPHLVGLAEVLRVAQSVGSPLPREIAVIAVEAIECSTVGGSMHPAVAAAIPRAVELVGEFLRSDPAWTARIPHG